MTALAPLAVSLGDPAGVGPELIAEAWSQRQAHALPPFFVVGGAQVLSAAAQGRGSAIAVVTVSEPSEAKEVFGSGIPVLGSEDGDWAPGKPSRSGASLALRSLEIAAQLAFTGQASGLVTGPVSKALLADVGFIHPGQTEFVAEACSVEPGNAVMMLAGPSLRTVPLTIHIPLADVPRALNTETIVRKARIVANALKSDFGIASPRLAICGLNPHSGEDGRFGSEEASIIAPAIEALRSEGIEATGPHPADSLFAPHERARYDAALAMYHDQALIPIKALDFDRGVNVTLGLPIVRTSPDHGTAFSIAGKGVANPGAMIAAIRMAGECAGRRATV